MGSLQQYSTSKTMVRPKSKPTASSKTGPTPKEDYALFMVGHGRINSLSNYAPTKQLQLQNTVRSLRI